MRARNMRRSRQKPVRIEHRRLFMKLTGVAILSACLNACMSTNKELEKIEKWERDNSIYTSNRVHEGVQFSVKREIENTPLIAEREMLWIKLKGKPGAVYRNALIRGEHSVNPAFNHPHTVSTIHTHHLDKNTSEKYKNLFKKIRATIPYPDFTGRKADQFVRNRHVGVIDENGKLEGYVTLHFTKNWAKGYELGKLEKEYKKLEEANQKVQSLLDNEQYDSIESAIDEYHQELKKLEKNGVRIRVTPMPGYIFKDGYFQKKN